MSDTAKLREALHSPGAFSGSRTPEESRVVYDAAWELLTIREAGALIIEPFGSGWRYPNEAVRVARVKAREVGHEDGLRLVLNAFLDALRDAIPPEDAK